MNLQTSKRVIAEGLAMLVTAFSFVAALAWNEAVKELISQIVPHGQGVVSLLIYAILVTVIAIIISVRLMKLRERLEKNNN